MSPQGRRHLLVALAKVAGLVLALYLVVLGLLVWGARAEELPARRVWVVDGDTLDLPDERVRLLGIDTPEVSHPSCPAEAAKGREAKAAAIALVRAGRSVTVTRTGRRDPYGRTLADVAIDGADLGQALLARGLALPWRPGPAARAERVRHWCGG